MRLQLPTGDGGVALKIFPAGITTFKCAKTAFVDGRIRTDQRFERDPRRGHRAGLAGIDRARHLIADLGKIDRHVAAGDFDFDFQRHRPVEIDAVAIEQRFGFVFARFDARNLFPRQSLGLPPDRSHALQKSVQARNG